jgi:muconolactone delta-isomerase
MEYLVTMTTQVPNRVTESEVANVRAREAAHTHDLAIEGRILRLWRPPFQPGEWRTIGLFAADNRADLEHTLVSMPLRVWRQDEVTPLGSHPNDPGRGRTALDPALTEFLTTFVLTVPPTISTAAVEEANAREAERARELSDGGWLIRLWSLPLPGRNLGLWQATDNPRMQSILRTLPLAAWLTTNTVSLTRHPNDPVMPGAGARQPLQMPTADGPRTTSAM